MIYTIKVLGFNPDIEEEILVEVNGISIQGFMPFGADQSVQVGEEFPVLIELTVLDDISITEIPEGIKGIERIDSSFSYMIRGKFNANEETVDVGIKFKVDRDYLDGYWYLDGKYIEFKVDRISIKFLED